MSRYQRRHYEDVAKILNRIHTRYGEGLEFKFILGEFVNLFKEDNPKFDFHRFIEECRRR